MAQVGDRPSHWPRDMHAIRGYRSAFAIRVPAVDEFIRQNLVPATREPAPTLGKPKSAEHKRRIAEAQKAAWARRKATKA